MRATRGQASISPSTEMALTGMPRNGDDAVLRDATQILECGHAITSTKNAIHREARTYFSYRAL